MILSTLGVLLKGDATHFTATMKRARGEASGFASQMKNISSTMTALKVAGAGLATNAIVQKSMERMNAVEQAQNFADTMGTTQEKLQGLRHAAITNGSAADVMDSALERMSDTLGEAINGSDSAAAAFNRIGLSVDDLKNKDVAAQFSDIAEAISRIQSPAQRVAAIKDIFGRGGLSLHRLFLEGAEGINKATDEAKEFGVALSDIETKKILAANDATDKLGQAWDGLANKVSAKIAPAWEYVVTKIKDAVVETGNALDALEEYGREWAQYFGAADFGQQQFGAPGKGMGGAFAETMNGAGGKVTATAMKSIFVDTPKPFSVEDYRIASAQRFGKAPGGPNDVQKQQLAEIKGVREGVERLLAETRRKKPDIVISPTV